MFKVIGRCGAFEVELKSFDSRSEAEKYRERVWARVGGEFDAIYVK